MTFTEYPEADIRTHRWIAKWSGRLGVLVGIVGVGYGQYIDDTAYTTFAIAAAALIYTSALGVKVQAIEWQLEVGNSD